MPASFRRIPIPTALAESARLFAHPAVGYIHVRNTEAGCYIARLEPAASDASAMER